MKEHLVLVPGIDGTGKLFYRQIPRLEERFTVTTIRLRDDAETMADLVADLHDEIARVAADGRRVSLLGESFGGALTLSYAVRHPERVELTVENTGAKLTPQVVATLPEPFQRATRRVRTDHAGVGLGLAIVKSIAQAHDGNLTLVPRPGGGLCATVQIPS